MKINDLIQLKKIILDTVKENTTTAVLTHIKPDGDGIGAALALQEFFYNRGIRIEIILEKQLPENYSFLQPEDRVSLYSEDHSFQNILVLDCHERSRLGECAHLLDKAEKVIVIDHHLLNNVIESDHYLNADMVSVGAIIFRMFEPEIGELNKTSVNYIATALYVSIINDTENFINSNTDAETFRICAELEKMGLEPGYVTKQFLMNKTPREMKYIGRILTTIEEHYNGRVVFIHSLNSMLEEYGLPASVNSKILRWLKGLKNVEIIVYFSETSNHLFKLSLRSEIIDVNRIAKKFGGGGHKNASGCSNQGSLQQIKTAILAEIKKQIK